jgi:hypothetical protein
MPNFNPHQNIDRIKKAYPEWLKSVKSMSKVSDIDFKKKKIGTQIWVSLNICCLLKFRLLKTSRVVSALTLCKTSFTIKIA